MEKELTIERNFNAPVEDVWKMWSDPEGMKKWWGPRGFSAPKIETDFREGGKYLFNMHGSPAPEAPPQDFWSTGRYKEIVPMKKIVLTDSFSDEKGNAVPSDYYGMKGFPMETEVMILFEGMGDKTRMILKYPYPGDFDEKMLSDMKQGWEESFDKMSEALQ